MNHFESSCEVVELMDLNEQNERGRARSLDPPVPWVVDRFFLG